jgi:tetratricopeptide (TPR) repeat protein
MPDELLNKLNETGSKVTSYPLLGFELEETLEYFNVMVKATRKENPQSAKRIQSIPVETRRVIHDLTQGEPFVLALLIDYVAITDELPSLTQRELGEFRKELRDRIIEAIQMRLRPSDEVVQAVSWTPKGMGSQLLAWVFKHDQPSEEEIENAKGAIEELRSSPKKRLSFVKISAADDLVFFQDEMYSLMKEMHNNGGMETEKEKIDRDILNFYEWKIRETRGKIQRREIELDATRHTPEKLPHLSPTVIIREEQRISGALARLQAYQVEHVYYNLRANPSDGFKLYQEYAEEAFQSSEENLWLLLQDELLRYAYECLPTEGLTWEDIGNYMWIRWIRSSLAKNDLDKADQRISLLRKASIKDLMRPGSYMDLELKILETNVLAYTGRDPEKARVLLNEVLENVKQLPSETIQNKWQISFLKANAMYWHGYLSRMQGEFEQAIKWYLMSVPLWRELKFEVMAALTLNDLSYAEMEAGDFDIALSHCKDALNLRRMLGKPGPIALSLNTLGLIEIRSGKPETARFHCEQALEIFRRSEDPRGIGLACHALAESLRRTTNTDLFVYAEPLKIEYLSQAAERAEEAVMIFTEKYKDEPLRLAEAYMELGCVYREWIRSLPKEYPERTNQIERSRVAYEKAVIVARESGYEYRAIDALVNMAWLFYYLGDLEKAREILAKNVRDYIGDEYLFSKEHGVVQKTPTPWHWVQLGKANVLLGMMFFDEYLNSPKDSQLSKQKLQQAAHNWTLSMAYNTLYGKDFRDFKKGREDVYKRLSTLNSQEMRWVRQSMERTHNEYHIPNEQRAFEQQLLKKLLQE